MPQRSREIRLPGEPGAVLLVAGHLDRQDLQRLVPRQPGVLCQIHLTHASRPQRAHNLDARKRRTVGQRRGCTAALGRSGGHVAAARRGDHRLEEGTDVELAGRPVQTGATCIPPRKHRRVPGTGGRCHQSRPRRAVVVGLTIVRRDEAHSRPAEVRGSTVATATPRDHGSGITALVLPWILGTDEEIRSLACVCELIDEPEPYLVGCLLDLADFFEGDASARRPWRDGTPIASSRKDVGHP